MQTLLIFSGIGSVLVLASLAGAVLQVRTRATAAAAAIENLNARIKGWWVIAVILGGALLAGHIPVIALFATISFLSLREFLSLTVVEAADHRALSVCFLIGIPFQYVLIGAGRPDAFMIFVPVFTVLIVPILVVLSAHGRNFLARVAELSWGLLICVYCISHVPALLMLGIPGDQDRKTLLMVFLIVVAQASDVLQYVWGKLLGRHKIAPVLSPLKTVEGTIGGMASATALGAALWWITPFSLPQAGAMAFIITLAGFLGGLVLSAVKRDRGAKDWSRLIPGHGGMLDRLDSLCFSAPIFFHLTRCFFTQ
jgi:phosphatidate cytidylyltransferase